MIRRLALRSLARGVGRHDRPDVAGEIEIARPVEEVFAVVGDERQEPRWNPRLRSAEQITPGPIGRGTRFRVETAGRRSVPIVLEYTEYAAPIRVGSVSRLPGMDIVGRVTLESKSGGTRLHWAWQLRPQGMMRLLRPAIRWIGRRQERQTWARLRAYLEQGQDRDGRGLC